MWRSYFMNITVKYEPQRRNKLRGTSNPAGYLKNLGGGQNDY